MANEELVVSSDQRVIAATAEELGAEMSGQAPTLPPDIQAKAKQWLNSYKKKLVAQTENYLQKQAEGVAPQAGEPVVGGYLHWDMLSISPIQFAGVPPYLPNRIIASGEAALLVAVLFVNPAIGPGGLSATTILGGRQFRVRFEQINLTDVTDGPDFTFTGTFPALAPTLSIFSVITIAPNPGPNPRLVEMNVTADIVNLAQPFAAFATHHINIDSEPGFLGIPPVAPQLLHDIPMRYLIYPK